MKKINGGAVQLIDMKSGLVLVTGLQNPGISDEAVQMAQRIADARGTDVGIYETWINEEDEPLLVIKDSY